MPHFDSKWLIEQHIAHLNLPATILRPTFFMEGLTELKYGAPAGWGMMHKIIDPQQPIQWVAVDDIGAVATTIFSNPERFMGHDVAVAGDKKTIAEACQLFKVNLPFRLRCQCGFFNVWSAKS